MDANCDNPSTSPGGSLSLLHQIFSFTQNGGRRANICLGSNSGKNDVQRDSQNSTENTSKSFSWDKCCGKIIAQTVFTKNFPFSTFETHISCTVSFEAFYSAFILGKGAIRSCSYETIILRWGSLCGFFLKRIEVAYSQKKKSLLCGSIAWIQMIVTFE